MSLPIRREGHGAEAPRDQDERRARVVLVAWNLGYLVLVPLGVAQAARDGATAWTYVPLAALAVAQVWLALHLRGRALMGSERDLIAFLVVVCVSTAAAVLLDQQQGLLLIVVIPQLFALTSHMLTALGLSVALVVAGFGPHVSDSSGLSDADGVQTVLIFVLAAAVAAYTLSLLRVSRRRGELIDQLMATRRELADAHHAMGVQSERARLARDIHDTLAQGFTSLLLLLEAAEGTLSPDDTVTAERLRMAREIARHNLAEARELVAAGPTEAVADSPLETALQRACDRMAREAGIVVEFDVVGVVRVLDAGAYVLLMRACQEALTNVRRHSGAGHVQVTVTYHPHRVVLTVRDDGRGFDPAGEPGFGLRGMRARAEQVGARFEVTSSPGDGTVILIEAS